MKPASISVAGAPRKYKATHCCICGGELDGSQTRFCSLICRYQDHAPKTPKHSWSQSDVRRIHRENGWTIGKHRKAGKLCGKHGEVLDDDGTCDACFAEALAVFTPIISAGLRGKYEK